MSDPLPPAEGDLIRDLRVWLIRVILWSLGLAAVMGVLAVLTGSYEVGLRAAGTALLTAAASGILWSVGSLDPVHRSARMTGLVSTLVTYACLLLCLWDVGPDEELALSALLTSGGGLIAMVSLMLLPSERTHWTGLCGLVSCGLLWITGIVGIWTDAVWAFRGDVAETWFAFAGSALLASLSLVGVRFVPQDWWRWLGVGAAGVAFVLVAGMIWDIWPESEEAYAAAITIAVVVSHANLILLAPLGERHRWLQVSTIAAAVVTGIGIDLILLAGGSPGEILGRITAAASILSGVGTLAVIVLALYFRPRSKTTHSRQPRDITCIELRCPVCGRKQSLNLDGDHCRECGLSIDVRLPEGNPKESTEPPAASPVWIDQSP